MYSILSYENSLTDCLFSTLILQRTWLNDSLNSMALQVFRGSSWATHSQMQKHQEQQEMIKSWKWNKRRVTKTKQENVGHGFCMRWLIRSHCARGDDLLVKGRVKQGCLYTLNWRFLSFSSLLSVLTHGSYKISNNFKCAHGILINHLIK